MQKLVNEILPEYLGKLEARVQNGHLACGKLTWADLFLTSFKGLFKWAFKDFDGIFNAYPNLRAVTKSVSEIPSIKKWLEESPKGMF